jgi:hypothetical protein
MAANSSFENHIRNTDHVNRLTAKYANTIFTHARGLKLFLV